MVKKKSRESYMELVGTVWILSSHEEEERERERDKGAVSFENEIGFTLEGILWNYMI